MLRELHLQGIGPAPKFDVEFGDRLNILTGDNGLGKSFLLDVAWFALTDTWAGEQALPNIEQSEQNITPHIRFQYTNDEEVDSPYLFDQQKWQGFQRLQEDAIAIYSRIDGGFSVFDPLRKFTPNEVYNFTSKDLLNGLVLKDGRIPCMGLIHDLDYWRLQQTNSPYQILQNVIQHLSHPDESMQVGPSVRLKVDDSRQIPTLTLPYGSVPITQASSGMQRILSLAYILVWAWDEHVKIAKLKKSKPLKKFVFLIDELDAHLHPKWQRTILPAILQVCNRLNSEINVQAIITTHSPIVLASAEPLFDEQKDKLFLFELEGQNVRLDELGWVKQGEIDNWLTSPIFNLKRPRSREAEEAVEAGYALMRGEPPQNPDLSNPETLDRQLHRLLPEHDQFLRIWNMKRQEVQR
jgi:predicted ATPase